MVKLVNAKQFALMHGFPVSTVRRFCREGLVPCWNFKSAYLLDPDVAMKAMLGLQNCSFSRVVSPARSGSSSRPVAFSPVVRKRSELAPGFIRRDIKNL